LPTPLTNRAEPKSVRYANKVLTVMRHEKKPDNYSDADWEKQKPLHRERLLGAGRRYMMTQEWQRRMLPAPSPAVMTIAGEFPGGCLFYLGWAELPHGALSGCGNSFPTAPNCRASTKRRLAESEHHEAERRIP